MFSPLTLRVLSLFFATFKAVELGADSLLIDEDTCATNFMIRDTKMMQLVACEKEPITPFVRVVTSLKERGVSTVMVIGGTGDFFDVADHVLVMDCYRCRDATARAREIVAQHRAAGEPTTILAPFAPIRERHLLSNVLQPNGKVKVQTRNVISYGETDLDLSALEQIVSNSQANGISSALQTLAAAGGDAPLRSALESLDRLIDSNGLDALAPGQFNGGLMRPRLLETGGAINRLRRDFIKQR
jgi:predicted ABC-class ATPase